MILVIGTNNCSRCNMVKGFLSNKSIDYEYKVINDLPDEEKDKYMAMAKQAGIGSFPLIIKNDTIITIQEV